MQALAQRSRGLLLLTATPLRQGLETQFALMHLVDPDRFARLDDFLEENKHLMQVGNAARAPSQGSKTAARELRKLFSRISSTICTSVWTIPTRPCPY